MSEPWRTKMGCQNSGNDVYSGRTNEKGDLIETETSIISGILTDITKVTKDNGNADIYVDKTWIKVLLPDECWMVSSRNP